MSRFVNSIPFSKSERMIRVSSSIAITEIKCWAFPPNVLQPDVLSPGILYSVHDLGVFVNVATLNLDPSADSPLLTYAAEWYLLPKKSGGELNL